MKWPKREALALWVLVVLIASTLPLMAQDTPIGPEGTQVATEATPAAAVNTDALRNAAQNPIASLISVPIQHTWNFGIGPADRTQNILNIQPVIPFSAGKNWNLITRWITPSSTSRFPYRSHPAPRQQTGV